MQLDILPYKIFKQLKLSRPSAMVLVSDEDLHSVEAQILGSHRAYLERRFAKIGIEILRWAHEYDTLNTIEPKLGLVYLANDSDIVPGIEVWCLIGHNARYLPEAQGTAP